MKALLKNYHQAPRKVRLIADLIRGKSVPAAQAALHMHDKKAAPAMKKLLDSAVANARLQGIAAEDLVVRSITVDKGLVMKRFRPFARGRSGRLNKATSIVKIELASVSAAPKAAKKAAAQAAEPKAKAAPKKIAVRKTAKKTA